MKDFLSPNAPIAVFDSGVGGISVLRELVGQLPYEDFVFFGDSKNAPYGTRTLKEVRSLTEAAAGHLISRGCKALVLACNTATSASVERLREKYPHLPIVGLEPSLKPACEFMEHPAVLVMATPMTVRETKFKTLLSCYENKADIYLLPCPGLVEFVERGELCGPEIERHLEALLEPYRDKHFDAVVLGCTHYPFAAAAISKVIGCDVKMFDGGFGAAKQTRRLLDAAGLLKQGEEKGYIEILNSSDDPDMISLCRRLLESEKIY